MTESGITECDLQAYIDEQLDAAGRLEVADYLVRNLDVAARVLEDLRNRDAMRALAGGRAAESAPRLAAAAKRLDTALSRQRLITRLSQMTALAAALLAFVTIGLAYRQNGHIVTPAKAAVPVFIEEALMSHRTALVRSHMRSQPEVPHFDPSDVRHATHINVPRLPNGWRILDVQLFPSDYGPSLQIVIDAGQKQPISLFAARASMGLPGRPTLKTVDGDELAYWAREGTVYVLTGVQSKPFLAAAAADLADNQDS